MGLERSSSNHKISSSIPLKCQVSLGKILSITIYQSITQNPFFCLKSRFYYEIFAGAEYARLHTVLYKGLTFIQGNSHIYGHISAKHSIELKLNIVH